MLEPQDQKEAEDCIDLSLSTDKNSEMNLTPGQLYFINEQDVRSGAHTPYYKIGIVRNSDKRDSRDRLLEHQTGNPRKLCVVSVLEMPAVEYVETILHYNFARNRVLGEWMEFTPIELENAISNALQLKEEIERNLVDIEKAEQLKDVESNGKQLSQSEESQHCFEEILTLSEIQTICEKSLAEYRNYISMAIEKNVLAPGVAKTQKRNGAKKFDERIFASKYPNIFGKYIQVKWEIRGSFRLLSKRDFVPDISFLPSEQVEAATGLLERLATADFSLETGFELHERHLAVLEVLKYAEYRIEMARVKLRVLVGKYDGIENICTWRRVKKEIQFLDKKSLSIDHPAEYSECVIEGEASEVLIVEPRIAGVSS